MDRNIVYPGSIPLDTDLLNTNRNVMVALGFLAQATLGSSTVVDGLALSATQPASMTVNVGPGSILALSTVDASAYGSLAADTSDPLVKMGINLVTTPLAITAPATPGQSQAYLIQATFAETDTGPTVLPYYNAANPAQPYAGPNNTGASQNTVRAQWVTISLKPGVPAASGTQATPAVDAGYVGLYVVTVTNGQAQIGAGDLVNAQLPSAPFIPQKLPAVQRIPAAVTFAASGSFTVPVGISRLRVRAWGGGGGGGGASGAASGGSGGGGGEFREGVFAVTPGSVTAVTVGAGGAGGAAGTSGTDGGVSSVAGLILAQGGSRGVGAAGAVQGAVGAGGTGGAGGHLAGPGAPGGGATAFSGTLV
ncbi:glycine-rich domain-containing protein, partial [Limobrevibacterium gyesilva]